jgi:hypothetical protein
MQQFLRVQRKALIIIDAALTPRTTNHANEVLTFKSLPLKKNLVDPTRLWSNTFLSGTDLRSRPFAKRQECPHDSSRSNPNACDHGRGCVATIIAVDRQRARGLFGRETTAQADHAPKHRAERILSESGGCARRASHYARRHNGRHGKSGPYARSHATRL